MNRYTMNSYLSLIPISARVRRRQNRMTLLCIIFAVFLVTAIFSVADMYVRVEQARLTEKHDQEFTFEVIMDTAMGQTLFLTGADPACGGADDFGQHQQHRGPADKVFRNDALHRHEPRTVKAVCAAGGS